MAGAKIKWGVEINSTPTLYVAIYLKYGIFIFDKKGYNKGTYVKEYAQCIYKNRFKIRTFFVTL